MYTAKIETQSEVHAVQMNEPRHFWHIEKRKGRNSIEEAYPTTALLDKKFIIHDETYHKYLVFDSLEHYVEWFEKQPTEIRTFHEVIFGWKVQKVKVDLDMEIEKLTKSTWTDAINTTTTMAEPVDNIVEQRVEPADKAQAVVKNVVSALKNAFYYSYFIDLTPRDIIICDSSDHRDKFSYHIIIDNYALSDYMEGKILMNMMYELTPQWSREFIDVTTYKSLQNFRLFECHKVRSTRIKRVPINVDKLRTVITNTSYCRPLPKIGGHREDVTAASIASAGGNTDIPAADISRIVENISTVTHGHILRERRRNMLVYNRQHPTHCTLCQRVHEKDHTMYITVVDDNGILKAFEHCRHNIDNNTRLVCEILSSEVKIADPSLSDIGTPTPTLPLQEVTRKRSAEARLQATIIKNSHQQDSCLFDTLPNAQRNVYDEPKLRPFEMCDTLCVRANMKMGKTKALREYLDTYFPAGCITNPIIRFLSFRQTFSSTIKEKFPEFILYSEVKGPLMNQRLIIQVESLHRLDIEATDQPDLLIMDECESIFEQFDSGLLKSFSQAWGKFEWLIRYSKHMVLMDANLGDRTYRILKRMRIDFHNALIISDESDKSTKSDPSIHPINPIHPWSLFLHHNKFRNATADHYHITTDRAKWYYELHSTVSSNMKVAIPSSSLTEAELLRIDLTAKYPHKSIGMYSSRTSAAQKREHFNNVAEYWSQYDILIYTPTVTAGISYEKKHFNTLFAYFTDRACNAETCQQMLGRVRNVESHQFYICLSTSRNNLPENTEDIDRYFTDRRFNLFKDFSPNLLQTEYDAHAHVKKHESNYYYLWLENMRVRHISINDFARRFVRIISNTGAEVSLLTVDASVEELADITLERKQRLIALREHEAQLVADSPELDDEAVNRIEAKERAEEQLTPEEEAAFRKYKLRRDYNWNGAINVQFVLSYDCVRSRRIFRRLTRILSSKDGELDALSNIKKDESANYSITMEGDEKNQYADLKRQYVYDIHRVANGIIHTAGFTGIFDRRCVHKNTIANGFEKCWNDLHKSIASIQTEFDIRNLKRQEFMRLPAQPAELYIKRVLMYANRVLSDMYDVTIVRDKTDPDMFVLSYGGLFSINADDETIPRIGKR